MNTQPILIQSQEIECSICLEVIDNASKKITPCNHVFHEACLSQIRANTCPLCRQVITEEPHSPFTIQWGLFEYSDASDDEDLDDLIESLQQTAQDTERYPMTNEARLENIRIRNMQMFESIAALFNH
jgi:hypothetical protein